MESITIGGNTYEAYASVADADDYMEASIGAVGDAWRAETSDDVKGRALVTTTRLLQNLTWVSGYDTDADWLVAIVSANIEYAAAVLEGSFVDQQTQAASGTKRLKAGTAEVEYFKSFAVKGAPATFLPPTVFALIKQWLSSGSSTVVGSAYSSGTDGEAMDLDYRRYY